MFLNKRFSFLFFHSKLCNPLQVVRHTHPIWRARNYFANCLQLLWWTRSVMTFEICCLKSERTYGKNNRVEKFLAATAVYSNFCLCLLSETLRFLLWCVERLNWIRERKDASLVWADTFYIQNSILILLFEFLLKTLLKCGT